jgi:hypothetical protein
MLRPRPSERNKTRIHFDRFAQVDDGFIVAARIKEVLAEVGVDD